MSDKQLSHHLFQMSGKSHLRHALWPLSGPAVLREFGDPRKQSSTYQRSPSTSEAPSACNNNAHLARTLRLPAPDTAAQGRWGSCHSKWQSCRSWCEGDSRQAAVKDLKAQLCGWATQPAKCHLALKVGRPTQKQVCIILCDTNPAAWQAQSRSSPEAEMLHRFSFHRQPQRSHPLPLSPVPSQMGAWGGGALAHSL